MPKMPHNNRMSSSAALKTHSIWTNTIGHDPHAPEGEGADDRKSKEEQAAGLLLLAKMSNLGGSSSRGACGKCGMAGHLTFQCRNVAKIESESSSDDDSSSDDEEVSTAEDKNADDNGSDEQKRSWKISGKKRDRDYDDKRKHKKDKKKKKEKSSKKHKRSKKEHKKKKKHRESS